MSPFAKVAATIGALWLAAGAIATIVYFTSIEHHVETTGQPFEVRHTSAYVGQLVAITVVAIVALIIAAVWARRNKS